MDQLYNQIEHSNPEPEPLTKEKLSTGISGNDWLCAACYNKITNENERFYFQGSSEFFFTNPDGIPFDIILFISAEGSKIIGEPTLEHTWFLEHAWSFSFCNKCGLHLGWRYTGEHFFHGLIKQRIVKALTIMN